jgi:hypothetical protein
MARRDMTDVATVVMETDRGHVVGVDCSVCWRISMWIKFYTYVPWDVSFQCCILGAQLTGRKFISLWAFQASCVKFSGAFLWYLLQENNLGYLKWSFTVYNQLIEYAAMIRCHIYRLFSFWYAYDLVEILDVWCNCKRLTYHRFFIHFCACFVTRTTEWISEDLHWSWWSNITLVRQPCSVWRIRIN